MLLVDGNFDLVFMVSLIVHRVAVSLKEQFYSLVMFLDPSFLQAKQITTVVKECL